MRRIICLAMMATVAACGTQPEMKAPVVQASQQVPKQRQAPAQVEYAKYVSNSDQIGDHYQSEAPAFWVRPGFRVVQVASGFQHARFMAFDDAGNLLVSEPKLGKVNFLRKSGDKYVLAAEFYKGVVYAMQNKEGWIYIASPGKIVRVKDADKNGTAETVELVLDGLPEGQGHNLLCLLVTDDSIYTGIGDGGNISDETATPRQKLWRYDRATKKRTQFASGFRNTEEIALRPGTNEIWGADHGSDWFGRHLGEKERSPQPVTDLVPPDELNHIIEGGFYGHPFLVGDRVPRYEYMNREDILQLAAKTIPPAWKYGAHWAANGFAFYTGSQFPAEYKGDLFQALHGSWNRTTRAGYRIERVLFDKVTGLPYGSQMLVGTLGPQTQVLGRPVDVVQEPGGALLFSDDYANAVFRIEYVGR